MLNTDLMPSSKINERVIKDHTNPKWILDGSSIWEDWLTQHAAKGGAAGTKVELLFDAQVHVDHPLKVREELLPHSGGIKVLDLRMSGFQTGDPGAEQGHAGEVISVFWRRALGLWRSWWKWLEAGLVGASLLGPLPDDLDLLHKNEEWVKTALNKTATTSAHLTGTSVGVKVLLHLSAL